MNSCSELSEMPAYYYTIFEKMYSNNQVNILVSGQYVPGSGSFMVGETKIKQQQDSVALEASLVPAESDFGAVAKADQYQTFGATNTFSGKRTHIKHLEPKYGRFRDFGQNITY
jgi:hypothetical protein